MPLGKWSVWQHATISYGSQKARMQSKRKQTEAEAEALSWVSITSLYSLIPHPQNLIGEGLGTWFLCSSN